MSDFAAGGYVEPRGPGELIEVGEIGRREYLLPDPLLKEIIERRKREERGES